MKVNTCKKCILLIVQYKYIKSCSGDLILQNLILCTKLCGTGFITQPSCDFDFNLTESVNPSDRIYHLEMICIGGVPVLKRHFGGAGPCHDVLVENNKTKYKKRWHGGKLGQTMLDSTYGLDQVVPERMSQVWR